MTHDLWLNPWVMSIYEKIIPLCLSPCTDKGFAAIPQYRIHKEKFIKIILTWASITVCLAEREEDTGSAPRSHLCPCLSLQCWHCECLRVDLADGSVYFCRSRGGSANGLGGHVDWKVYVTSLNLFCCKTAAFHSRIVPVQGHYRAKWNYLTRSVKHFIRFNLDDQILNCG